MDDRPIQVGDLVWVAKLPVCGCDLAMGWVFTVKEIQVSIGGCATCHADRGMDTVALFDGGGIELWRLKRIPPLENLEGLETQEKIITDIDIPLEV